MRVNAKSAGSAMGSTVMQGRSRRFVVVAAMALVMPLLLSGAEASAAPGYKSKAAAAVKFEKVRKVKAVAAKRRATVTPRVAAATGLVYREMFDAAIIIENPTRSPITVVATVTATAPIVTVDDCLRVTRVTNSRVTAEFVVPPGDWLTSAVALTAPGRATVTFPDATFDVEGIHRPDGR